jgi:hypothetical protein
LVKDAKATSAQLAITRLGHFKWRPTYAAFSVSRWNTRKIADYIERQKEHHENGTLKMPLESGDESHE